ncbi:MAG: histidine phosphatase family protein [Burkholderiaceae bacterium]
MKPAAATLLLIRHGETAWNAEHRIQGSLDIPLSATGFWQAGRLAERLAAERIDAIYASDLARAWLTAEPLAARLGLDLRADVRLRERCFGVFEGHTLDEIAARWPAEFAAWRERDPAWAMPEGESGAEFIERVNAALRDIACAWAGATVAVFAHGGVLDVAYRTARALAWDAPREHTMANAAINRIAAAAPPLRMQILGWGDVTHLSEARDETLI